jgi:23S rRNA pseudouridine1911/1915/1917 synthase
VVCRHLADLDAATRTRVQHWIESGKVTVNGAPVHRSAARVDCGELISIALPDPKTRRVPAPENLPLEILYEDTWLLAVNKPAGVVVHPTYKHADGTLLNALLWRARDWPAGERPTIVGRLDRLTSGLVIAAKTRAVHSALQRAMASADKEYLAVVYGRGIPARGSIDLRLGRARDDRRRVVVSETFGVACATRFERIARVTADPVGLSLVRCRLITGRMHQIRVHLAARGWPIVGDPVYGRPHWARIPNGPLAAALHAFERQALHAWRVTFVHPITDERMSIEAPPPGDFARLQEIAGLMRGPARRRAPA